MPLSNMNHKVILHLYLFIDMIKDLENNLGKEGLILPQCEGIQHIVGKVTEECEALGHTGSFRK